MIGFKKQSYSEEEIDKALEQPCYFCGSHSKFVFYLAEINKTTCIDCTLYNDEVEQFYEMKGRKV